MKMFTLVILSMLLIRSVWAAENESPCRETPLFSCYGLQKDLGHTLWLVGMACLSEDNYELPASMLTIFRAQVIEDRSVIVDRNIVIQGTYHKKQLDAKSYHYFYGNSGDLPNFSIMVDFVGNLAVNYARIGKVVYPIECTMTKM